MAVKVSNLGGLKDRAWEERGRGGGRLFRRGRLSGGIAKTVGHEEKKTKCDVSQTECGTRATGTGRAGGKEKKKTMAKINSVTKHG